MTGEPMSGESWDEYDPATVVSYGVRRFRRADVEPFMAPESEGAA